MRAERRWRGQSRGFLLLRHLLLRLIFGFVAAATRLVTPVAPLERLPGALHPVPDLFPVDEDEDTDADEQEAADGPTGGGGHHVRGRSPAERAHAGGLEQPEHEVGLRRVRESVGVESVVEDDGHLQREGVLVHANHAEREQRVQHVIRGERDGARGEATPGGGGGVHRLVRAREVRFDLRLELPRVVGGERRIRGARRARGKLGLVAPARIGRAPLDARGDHQLASVGIVRGEGGGGVGGGVVTLLGASARKLTWISSNGRRETTRRKPSR